MAGMQMMMLGAGGGIVTPISCGASSEAAGSGTSTATVWFNSDGSIIGSQTKFGAPNWYRPTVPSIGSQFWISFDGGAWASLTANPSTSLSGANNSVNRSIRIASDAGGANIVATGTVTLTVSNQV